MGFPWSKLATGALFLPQVIAQSIVSVEKLKGDGSGAEKKAAVQEIVMASLVGAGVLTGQAAFTNPVVMEKIGAASDAMVDLMNAVAKPAPRPTTTAFAP